jgi:hypothetical protein
MDKNNEKQLKELIELKSKHSQYQRLPSCLERILDGPVVGKYEEERMDFIIDNSKLSGNVLDIGGNTGYFTFEAITRGNAEHVDYYEGNRNHSDFVKRAAEYLGFSSQISVFNEYYTADESSLKYDVAFYLNVVHHLGKDYICGIDVEEAKKRMINELNIMSDYIKTLVFQMGYNWGGDIAYCLFDNGTKEEMIDFVSKGTKGYWKIKNVGIAIEKNGKTVYEGINDDNLVRIDSLGEFRNRPLFILESERYQ